MGLFAQDYLSERTAELFREIDEEYKYDIEEMEETKDHIHIFPSFSPKDSIGEVGRTLKSISARKLCRQYRSIKKGFDRVNWGRMGIFWGQEVIH